MSPTGFSRSSARAASGLRLAETSNPWDSSTRWIARRMRGSSSTTRTRRGSMGSPEISMLVERHLYLESQGFPQFRTYGMQTRGAPGGGAPRRTFGHVRVAAPVPACYMKGVPVEDPISPEAQPLVRSASELQPDRKSTRLNSSHVKISYAVFCLKTKNSTTA